MTASADIRAPARERTRRYRQRLREYGESPLVDRLIAEGRISELDRENKAAVNRAIGALMRELLDAWAREGADV